MISAFDIRLSRWYLRFPTALNVYFAICASKTLQKSSATQKISVILSSVIIAKFFCFIVFIHYKVTKNFANYQIFNELYFIELTLIYLFPHRPQYLHHRPSVLLAVAFQCLSTLCFGLHHILVLFVKSGGCRGIIIDVCDVCLNTVAHIHSFVGERRYESRQGLLD